MRIKEELHKMYVKEHNDLYGATLIKDYIMKIKTIERVNNIELTEEEQKIIALKLYNIVLEKQETLLNSELESSKRIAKCFIDIVDEDNKEYKSFIFSNNMDVDELFDSISKSKNNCAIMLDAFFIFTIVASLLISFIVGIAYGSFILFIVFLVSSLFLAFLFKCLSEVIQLLHDIRINTNRN